MTTYHTPGIYREDVFPTRRPGLATGVPAFLGPATGLAGDEPFRVTRLAELAERLGPLPSRSRLAAAVAGFFLNGGTECLVVPLADPLETDPEEALERGLAALAVRQDLDLVCVPDLHWMAGDPGQALRMQAAVLRHCHTQGDRFALLDAFREGGLSEVRAQWDELAGESGANGALYHPWLRGPAAEAPLVPPCGHVAGVVARCDRQTGVHKAPANEVLEGVVDLAARLTDADQTGFHPRGINALRAFPGRGIRIWGARTLSGSPRWAYINVRRLFLTVARWIELNLAATGFEPHDTPLWNRISRELTAFLEELYRAGALQGRTAAEAFFVKCDGETNPPEVRETGQVVVLVGLAPTAPSEFVVVRIVHGTGGVEITAPSQS
ncbi:MAG TPA: phage tail sheath subtilisin-like domain-containing protein [Thermoanaerobaculia bacterium]|nr:phage tail sheath subtilisin-like domain-containing protein [Thermoanaerobaculia bacterium]